jgi:hypothetical protein
MDGEGFLSVDVPAKQKGLGIRLFSHHRYPKVCSGIIAIQAFSLFLPTIFTGLHKISPIPLKRVFYSFD